MDNVARVVVEVAVEGLFDYLIPPELKGDICLGSFVNVPFGPRKVRAYVVELPEVADHDQLKPLTGLAKKEPVLDTVTLKLAHWISRYYYSTLEQAVRTILPSAVRRQDMGHKQRIKVSITRLAQDDQEALAALSKRAPRQAEVLQRLQQEGDQFMHQLLRSTGTSASVIKSLEHKGFVQTGLEGELRDPLAGLNILPTDPHHLMEQQKEALQQITASVSRGEHHTILLQGVTGSGKTEVYLQAIEHTLEQGRGAIILVPEIALTPQLVELFHGRFGDQIAVLHSHLSDGERHDEWHRLKSGKARIAIGARSAVFAPIPEPGLIVVDEEHEHSYKQEEAPRYHARDVAVVRGKMHRCTVVLGSATPSIESFYNARKGKYQRLLMPHRVDHRVMPGIHVVDMRAEAEKAGRLYILSGRLREAIQLRLDRAEQVILFLNRRGFATSLSCDACGHVSTCESCSIPLTYHRKAQRLRCHLCDAEHPVPQRCPNGECGNPDYRKSGIGTERVEETIRRVFKQARVERLDSDVTTKKDVYRRVLGGFRAGKVDILVGTQMIAKGLHFPNVTLVGVINADTILHMPDFRAGERTFQLITQVAGRAGRGERAGEVLVQTFTPYHPSIQAARRMDFDAYADEELAFRKELAYPPYTHLVLIGMAGVSPDETRLCAERVARKLRELLPEDVQVLGPSPAPIEKVKDKYRQQCILKAPRPALIIDQVKKHLNEYSWSPRLSCSVDVDPVSML